MVAEPGALTMWIVLKSKEEFHFCHLEDRLSLGSADSNHLALKSGGLDPIQGRFRNINSTWVFEHFHSSGVRLLPLSSDVEVGAWTMSPCVDLIGSFRQEIQSRFRKAWEDSRRSSFSEVYQYFKASYCFSRPLLSEIDSFFESQFNECRRESPVERLLKIEGVSDVLVENFDRIWFEQDGILKLSNQSFSSFQNYQIYTENLLANRHLSLSEEEPSLDFTMPSGARAHIVGPPLTSSGQIYLSIRKPRQTGASLSALKFSGFLDEPQLEALRQALRERLNILISGATGAGKTTLLRALIEEVEANERIIVVEDTVELLSQRANTVFLKTRLQSRGHLSKIDLQNLVRQTLRMRPDRIVIGEVRGAEALDLLHAMNTGHRGCLGSLHSNSVRDALLRFQSLVRLSERGLSEDVTRDMIAQNLQMLVHCEKVGPRRVVSEIGFVRGRDGNQILMETVCRSR